MNTALSNLAAEVGLLEQEREPLRFAFGLACASRVQHLLEDPRAVACLAVLHDFVAGRTSLRVLRTAADDIAAIANHHRGSGSIDGSAHAAVSATYAAANALAGRAIEAAGYAAYACVYAYGGYAVSDPSAFEAEFAWQVEELRRLAQTSERTMHIIESTALTLEPQMAAHAQEMFAVLSDQAIYEYENEPPPSIEWLRARFTRLESRRSPDGQEQWLNWVIRVPTSELIGYVQATVRPNGRAAIAYELSSRYWGRGLASQAVQAMIGELAERYQVSTLTAVFKRENHRSMRLLERLGFSFASPQEHVKSGAEPDERVMQLEIRRR